ncbi:MAG: hypothetical protein CUN57_03425, partial [Phototrophicales bacterium]
PETYPLLELMVHKEDVKDNTSAKTENKEPGTATKDDDNSKTLHPAAMINFLAKVNQACLSNTDSDGTYAVKTTYIVRVRARSDTVASLIDRGANGGVAGEHVRLLARDESGRS